MRFSLYHLLLIFPSLCIAHVVASIAGLTLARVTYKHDVAANDIRQISLFAEHQIDGSTGLALEDLDFASLWKAMGGNADPWGNPYQLVEMHDPSGRSSTSVQVYSFGRDGKSETAGNDVDDVNSWDYDRQRYYGAQLALEERKSNLVRTIWLTPLMYLALLLLIPIRARREDHSALPKFGIQGRLKS